MRILFCIFFLSLGYSGFAQKRQQIQYSASANSQGTSDAVIVDDVPLIHTTQFLPIDNIGGIIGKGDVIAQFNQVFSNISFALKNAGSNLDQIVKLNIYLRNSNSVPAVLQEISKMFKAGKSPALSFVTGNLSHTDALISADAIAVSVKINPESVKYFMPQNLSSNVGFARSAILPAGPAVYVSGQAVKGELAEATRATLEQLITTLVSLGLEKKDIVQIKSFIRPMSDLQVVEQEFANFFKGANIPPMVNVEWTSKDPVIEIELIASSPVTGARSSQQLDFITPPGMSASPVYCRVVRINYGQKIFISSLYGQKTEDADYELSTIFSSLGTILKKTGSDFSHLVKATYYVSNDDHSAKLNEIRPKYYDPLRPPAASKAMVKDVGKSQAGISMDMIGVVIK
jgi:enamine deaminase RidA (YjgF/YER057c/UK114 family)